MAHQKHRLIHEDLVALVDLINLQNEKKSENKRRPQIKQILENLEIHTNVKQGVVP